MVHRVHKFNRSHFPVQLFPLAAATGEKFQVSFCVVGRYFTSFSDRKTSEPASEEREQVVGSLGTHSVPIPP